MKHFLCSLIIFGTIMNNLHSQDFKKAYINGIIYTVDEKLPYAETVITEGNKIVFVGTKAEADKYIDNLTTVIDLKGRLILPGFNDNHVHFINGGAQLLGINLRIAKSTSEFKQILKDYTARNEGRWITGGDWDHEAWEIKDLPKKEWIDDFSKNTPIFVSRFDGHMALANSAALKLAGVDKNTPSPEGGLIVKDPVTGEPTGMLKDNAMDLIYSVIPAATEQETEESLVAALDEAKKNGFTSVQDITYKAHLRTYQKFEHANKLTCRIYTRLPISQNEMLSDLGIEYNFGNEKLKLGSLKAFADGSLGSSTALFFEPYAQDTSTVGLAMDIVTNGSLKKWSLNADRHKLQLSIHAIGDSANSLLLDMFEEITKTNPKWDRRFRIEHAQHIRTSDLNRFADLNVIASAQPYHAIDDGVWAEKRVGPERIKETYPFRSFLDKGVKLCFGSDWSVAPLNALLGIYAAVTRRTLDDKNPDGWIPEQIISVEDAIKCYTLNSAYASFEENIKGSIEPGKLADFVVLSDNILKIDPVKIKDVKVDMTIFDGEVIYTRSGTD